MTAIRPVLRHASPRKGDPFSGGEASRADAGLDAQRIQDFGAKTGWCVWVSLGAVTALDPAAVSSSAQPVPASRLA